MGDKYPHLPTSPAQVDLMADRIAVLEADLQNEVSLGRDMAADLLKAEAEVKDLREELREEAETSFMLTTRQSDLLTAVVNAIKGDPPELTTWSHHNAPELVADLKAEVEQLQEAARVVVAAFETSTPMLREEMRDSLTALAAAVKEKK